MNKMIVAYDGSPGSEAAMMDLVRGGFPEICEAKVLTIADVWLPPDPAEPPFPDRVAASRLEARRHALDAVAAAGNISFSGAERLRILFPKWTVHNVSHADSPAWGILAEARRWGAGLIVIGSHGRTPLQKFFLGSVSHKVAAEAPCSVRVFRPQGRNQDPALRIVVALDGSDDSDAAFNEVLDRKWPAETKFQLVTVIDPRLKAAPIADAGVMLPEQDESAEDWVPSLLARRAVPLQERNFEVSTHILEGDPKAALLRHAEHWRADAIFLGARGLQHGDRLYLGTFASAVVSRAHCTVEIVRPAIRLATSEQQTGQSSA